MTKFFVAIASPASWPACRPPRRRRRRAAADRVAVVVDAAPPGAAARVAAARADARSRDALLRAPRTLPEQLSVTARLAAEGYTTIVGYGVNEHAAIEPLDGAVRFVSPLTHRHLHSRARPR